MDTQTIDQEFEKLQAEFADVAKAVAGLATKMQAAQQAGDANATEWLGDLEGIAKEVDDEQTQAKVLLLALHNFIAGAAPAAGQAAATASTGDGQNQLFAPGEDPFADGSQQQQQQPQHHRMLGGLLGGMGGGGMGMSGMGGGYVSGGFGRSMEMGMGMQLGADLVSSIFR
jgi:seryl-tRNA synthetase